MNEYRCLMDQLAKGELGKRLMDDPAWEQVRLIAGKIAEVARMKLVKVDPIKDPSKVIRLQEKVSLYGEFAQNLAEVLYKEGNEAFKWAEEVGLADSLFQAVDQSETD